MSKRLYSHRCVKYWYCYDVDEVCAIFKETGLHPQTVRAWIKKRGLKTIDNGKPALIYGNDLIEYLKKNNSKNKCKTDFDAFFCMKCQDARPIFQKKIVIEQKAHFLKVHGKCRECKTTMFKSYKMADSKRLQKTFKLVDVLGLYDDEDSTCKTHIEKPLKTSLNESEQWSFSYD